MRELYHTPLSPFCRKVRVAMREKALDFELRDEPVWERREAFYAINPAGEVPVLMDENGLAVIGSYAICEYLEEGYPTSPSLLGSTLVERAEVRRLIIWFDVKFNQEATQVILFEKVYRRLMHYGVPDSDAIRYGRRNIPEHLGYVSELCSARTWLAGDTFSLADIAAAAHISTLDYLGDIPWENHPQVKEWYALVKSRPSFRPILLDRVRGFTPPEHYENPDF